MNTGNNAWELEFSQKHLLNMYRIWHVNSSKQYLKLSGSFIGFNKFNIIQHEHFSAWFTVKTFYATGQLFKVY